MAKKRKKEVKSYVFKKPEFDEVEYMKKEMGNTKIAIITIVFAIPVSVASYAVTLMGGPVFAFLLGFACIFLLRYIYEFLNVDISKFEKRDWLGNGAMFFFTWLAIWVLILNAPFTDLTKPTIGVITVEDCESPTTLSHVSQNTCRPSDNSTRYVTLVTRITDNSAIKRATINFTAGLPGYYNLIRESERGRYTYTFQLNYTESYTFTITAEDIHGHVRKSAQYTLTGV